jgi:hypothetical protein
MCAVTTSQYVDDYEPGGLDTDWQSMCFDGATIEQFMAYNKLWERWASVRMPYLCVGLGSAWVVEVSQEPGVFELPSGSTNGHGDAQLVLVIEADGYTHS